MRKLDKLKEWRRTHYSVEITPNLDGKRVTVFGWLASKREQGGITFWILHDKEGIVQITMHKGKTSNSILKKAENIREHSSIGVKGVVKSIDKAPHGAEIIPEDLRILSSARRQPPFSLFGGKMASIDKRLDIRVVDLRRPKAQAIFKIKHTALTAVRDFFIKEGYIEVNTPKIIATATEGGAALFPLLYYNKEAFLAQSPQLYKEQLIIPFEKVFEIGPIFRAEESRTLRHLSEVISIDVEEAFVSYEDAMKLIEQIIYYTVNKVRKNCSSEIELLGNKLIVPKLPFKHITYDDVLKILKKEDIILERGDDLSTQTLKILGEIIPEFYFITDWPTFMKPFYIKPKDLKQDISESFDFMHGSIELASGGSRISSKRILIKRLKEQGLEPKLFEYHLRIFDYGMPPHAGFGLGLERLIMVLTGQENIREVTLFPRDRSRLTP
ncbi:MAG: aspartate--tRNA(Asn) ligase [Candidatus Methylarchaceae archaeon HK02M2]|nr:aspartate--tRNA(Asn) ligase [Candidatus Methylarchaceae archaeon HK02M2]